MHNKDRTTDHQEQQACKDKTDHRQTKPPESVNKDIGTNTVEDISKKFEKQTEQKILYTHYKQVNIVPNGNSTSDTQWDKMHHNNSNNISQGRIAMNKVQKDNINDMPLHGNIEEPNENTTIEMRHGRVIRKPDRLTYY